MKLLFLLAAALAATAFAESRFACDRAALTPQARKRHFDELGPALKARVKSVRELSDGFAFEFPPDTEAFQLVSEGSRANGCAVPSLTSTCTSNASMAAFGCASPGAKA